MKVINRYNDQAPIDFIQKKRCRHFTYIIIHLWLIRLYRHHLWLIRLYRQYSAADTTVQTVQDSKIPMKETFGSAKDLLEVQKNSAIHAENYEKDKKFESRRVGAS